MMDSRFWVALAIVSCSGAAATRTVDGSAPDGDDGGALPKGDAAVDPCSAADAVQSSSVRAFVASQQHGDAFVPLDAAQMGAVGAAATALMTDDIEGARAHAQAAGFRASALVTPGECFWLLAPTSSAPAGQALLIVRRGWHRDLVVEAPHVPNDGNTDREAAVVFDGVGARALILAGAQRCASTANSGCFASTQCNAQGIPVESDPSHSIHTAFHAIHLAIAANGAPSMTLQLHTNLELQLNGDARLSNGTRLGTAGPHVQALYQTLLSGGGDIRSCNDAANPAPSGAFCGETNSQALATNGASPPECNRTATAANDRFLHLEQASAHLQNELDAWSSRITGAVATALAATH